MVPFTACIFLFITILNKFSYFNFSILQKQRVKLQDWILKYENCHMEYK